MLTEYGEICLSRAYNLPNSRGFTSNSRLPPGGINNLQLKLLYIFQLDDKYLKHREDLNNEQLRTLNYIGIPDDLHRNLWNEQVETAMTFWRFRGLA